MDGLRKLTKRFTILAGLWLLASSISGCAAQTLGLGLFNSGLFIGGFAQDAWLFSKYFVTTPPIPVSPYFSQEIEDTYVGRRTVRQSAGARPGRRRECSPVLHGQSLA